MPTIQEVLQKRINAYNDNTLERQFGNESKEYRKRWLNGVQHFVDEINKDRKKENKSEVRFMSVYMKIEHIKEIDDLLWFYKQCIAYRNKKKENTFSKCFYGSLKIR